MIYLASRMLGKQEVNPLDVLIKSGLSIPVMAERLGVNRTLVSKWIHGKIGIPKKWVSPICEKIG